MARAGSSKDDYERGLAKSPEDIEKILEELEDLEKTFDKTYLDELEYQGFDPSVTRAAVIGVVGFRAVEVYKLIAAYVVRGTNVDKIKETISDKARGEFTDLIIKYKIKRNVKKGDKFTITLSRLGAAFPDLVCRMCHESPKRKPPVTFDDLPKGFPRVMTTPVFSSIIPKGLQVVTPVLLDAHLLYQVRLDEVINDSRTSISDIIKYQKAGYNSTMMTQAKRVDFCIKVGLIIMNADGGYAPCPEAVWAAFCYNDEEWRYTGPEGVKFSDWEEAFLAIGISQPEINHLKKRLEKAEAYQKGRKRGRSPSGGEDSGDEKKLKRTPLSKSLASATSPEDDSAMDTTDAKTPPASTSGLEPATPVQAKAGQKRHASQGKSIEGKGKKKPKSHREEHVSQLQPQPRPSHEGMETVYVHRRGDEEEVASDTET